MNDHDAGDTFERILQDATFRALHGSHIAVDQLQKAGILRQVEEADHAFYFKSAGRLQGFQPFVQQHEKREHRCPQGIRIAFTRALRKARSSSA